MNAHSKQTLTICATILIVGLVFSAVLWIGLGEFNRNFRLKDFYGFSNSYDGRIDSTDAYQALRLNDRQFVVVSQAGNKVDVYRVDANGRVTPAE